MQRGVAACRGLRGLLRKCRGLRGLLWKRRGLWLQCGKRSCGAGDASTEREFLQRCGDCFSGAGIASAERELLQRCGECCGGAGKPSVVRGLLLRPCRVVCGTAGVVWVGLCSTCGRGCGVCCSGVRIAAGACTGESVGRGGIYGSSVDKSRGSLTAVLAPIEDCFFLNWAEFLLCRCDLLVGLVLVEGSVIQCLSGNLGDLESMSWSRV